MSANIITRNNKKHGKTTNKKVIKKFVILKYKIS